VNCSPTPPETLNYNQEQFHTELLTMNGQTSYVELPSSAYARPNMARRPSHDLFECIEQHQKLPLPVAKYVFSQVVDIVEYLASRGVTHRDIKDENLVIDEQYRVRIL
jgi:serine/threonine protein kinase